MFISFFEKLCSFPINQNINDYKYYYKSKCDIIDICHTLDSFFITSYSIIDIIKKILYEIKTIKEKKEEIIYIGYKKIKNEKFEIHDYINITNTVFENNKIINMIESIRNDVVHNKSLFIDFKVHIKLENNNVIEKFILMPDFSDEGRFVTYSNRNRFFNQGNKFNYELIKIYTTILELINNTIIKIIKYAKS